MKTRYLSTRPHHLAQAAEIIRAGGLVAFPTETVYGLGGDAQSPASAALIYQAKGRPRDNPLIVHLAEGGEGERWARRLPAAYWLLAERFWPGPLTLIVERGAAIPLEVTGGLDTVALRVPDQPVARELIRLAETPIAAPSANRSGRPSPTRWERVKEDLDGRIDAVIMGPPSPGGIESTVLDLTREEPRILRPGLVSPRELAEALGRPVVYDPSLLSPEPLAGAPGAPGMKYRHYAPRAQMLILTGEEEAVALEARRLQQEEEEAGRKVVTLLFGGEDSRFVAREFFERLREADEQGADLIIAQAVSSEDSLGFSIMNRMLKAAGYRSKEV